jgi:hypothetical protein
MSSVAFGALTTRRESSESGKSTFDQPPGLNSYVDTLAALVPAEVLAIHALIVSTVTTSNSRGQIRIIDSGTALWAFWLLLGLSAGLFVLGRGGLPAPAQAGRSGGTVPLRQRWERQDWIRLLIPPAAFVGWTMLEPASVWHAVVPNVSGGMRVLIAAVGAVALAAVTKALTTHADNRPPPGKTSVTSQIKSEAVRDHGQSLGETATGAYPVLQSALQNESTDLAIYRVLDLDVLRRLTRWKWQTGQG